MNDEDEALQSIFGEDVKFLTSNSLQVTLRDMYDNDLVYGKVNFFTPDDYPDVSPPVIEMAYIFPGMDHSILEQTIDSL